MGWLPIASAIFTGVSAISNYSAQKKAAKQTQAANAAMMSAAQEESRLLREDAAYSAAKERKEAARVRSQQVALYLKSGVTLDGSPMLVMEDTTNQGEENANNIITNAASQSKSMLLRAQGSQQPVTRANLFGTVADVFSAGASAKASYKTAYGKK